MKKESKEMLKTIISNQELIMKSLNIVVPVKVEKKVEAKKADVKKVPAKKIAVKRPVKKVAKRK